MAPSKQGRKIAFVGATGTVGRPTLDALIAEGVHTITVITRPDSTGTIPEAGVARVERGTASDAGFLAKALEGQEALLMQLAFPAMGDQRLYVEAAAKAGVGMVVPTEFGSDTDPSSRIFQDVSMMQDKKAVREQVEALGMGCYTVVNNPWFDWSLKMGLWGFDLAGRKAKLFGGGNTKFSTTNLGTVARATAALLSLPDQELARFRNKAVFLQSYHMTQRELFASLVRATGTKEQDWTVEEPDAGGLIAEGIKTDPGPQFFEAFYAMHMTEGMGGDYGHKVGDTMEVLGVVEKETLDQAVARVVKAVGVGSQ